MNVREGNTNTHLHIFSCVCFEMHAIYRYRSPQFEKPIVVSKYLAHVFYYCIQRHTSCRVTSFALSLSPLSICLICFERFFYIKIGSQLVWFILLFFSVFFSNDLPINRGKTAQRELSKIDF